MIIRHYTLRFPKGFDKGTSPKKIQSKLNCHGIKLLWAKIV